MDLCRCIVPCCPEDVLAITLQFNPRGVVEIVAPRHVVERWIGWTLRIGVWGSAGLMVLGLALAWFFPTSLRLPSENPRPADILHNLFSGSLDPVTLMFAGILFLMLTPFLRVLTAAAGFAAEKDRTFVLVALVVFAMLIGELVFSLR
jgi:uncharacterized membrane protein